MKLQLIEKNPINEDTLTFRFKPESPFNWTPGQFLRYNIPNSTPDERGPNRFFSIASSPFEGVVQITTKFDPVKSSTFKKDLQKLKIGDSIEAFGPSGSFTIEDVFVSEGKKLCFIAGGIGITPLRSILLDLDYRKQPLNVTLLYANRTQNPLFKDELEALAKRHPEFKIYYIISDEPVAQSQVTENVKIIPGKINENLIRSLISDFRNPIYYISGPEPMVQSFEKMIWDMGIPKENTKRDYFPGYENF